MHCDGPRELLTSEEVEENAYGVVPTRVRQRSWPSLPFQRKPIGLEPELIDGARGKARKVLANRLNVEVEIAAARDKELDFGEMG